MPYGWSGRILRIDLSEEKSLSEDVTPYSESFIGGRGINTKIMYDEVGAEISPFDQANRLCLGPGVLAGTLAPSSSRTRITSMSPRGCLGAASIGGFIGAEIRYAGYDNIIVQGKSDRPVYVYVHDDSVEFRDASHIWGKNPWETQQMIRDELGNRDVQAVCIGRAGEKLVSFACIGTGRFLSTAGRYGLGAIMGSKNLKAIAVRGTHGIRIAKEDEFIKTCLEMHNSIRQSGAYYEAKRNDSGSRNVLVRMPDSGKFVAGNWENADWYKAGFIGGIDDAEEFWNKYAAYQMGCFGCPMYHATTFEIPGIQKGSTLCVGWLSFGGTVWVNDRELITQANCLCEEYGLDIVSTAACISFLMELYHRGIITKRDTDGIPMRRGDKDAIISTIHKIGNQEGFGELFRDGVIKAARTIGKDAEEYVMQVKGLELYPLELRAYKSMALCTAIGRTHDFSHTDSEWTGAKEECERWAMDLYGQKDAALPTSYKGKALSVWDTENRHCLGDILGVCKWLIPWGPTPFMRDPAKLFSLATGTDTTEDELLTVAQRTLTLERAFDTIKGIRRKDDTLPKRLFEEPVPDGRFKGEVLDKEQFVNMLNEYYTLRGWNTDGIPTEETFKKLSLSSEWKVFKKRLHEKDSSKK